MRVLFMIAQLAWFLLSPPASADTNAPSASLGGDGSTAVTAFANQFKGIVAGTSTLTDEQRLQQLVKSVDAITTKGMRISTKRKRRIAAAALAAEKTTKVDATLMIAVARIESDFRGLTQVSPKCLTPGVRSCHADCGITQHYISGKKRWVIKECNRLAHNYKVTMLKSAREIARHVKWCSTHPKYQQPLRRCVLNRYNSGTFYKTKKRCKKRWKPIKIQRNETWWEYTRRKQRWRRGMKMCYGRAAYWKKVLCFDFGARNLIKPKRSCRWCYSLNSIATRFYPPATTLPAKASTAAKPSTN